MAYSVVICALFLLHVAVNAHCPYHIPSTCVFVCVLYNVCVVTIAIKVSVVKLLLLYIKFIIKVMVYRQIL